MLLLLLLLLLLTRCRLAHETSSAEAAQTDERHETAR